MYIEELDTYTYSDNNTYSKESYSKYTYSKESHTYSTYIEITVE